jgi:hypothetical protein
MASIAKLVAHVRQIAEKSGTKFEVALNVLQASEEVEATEKAGRQATPEEKDKIILGLPEFFDANPNLEITNEELADKLGVRAIKGTLWLIGYAKKQYLITHKKDGK